jgi:hypothetical protein
MSKSDESVVVDQYSTLLPSTEDITTSSKAHGQDGGNWGLQN